ncbi:DUF4258 domain-containing protein [Candidatus Parcubacteria bacterium]|nr:DUF4258 domain-containing protein [Candidatus Parcubacteria bacterium]
MFIFTNHAKKRMAERGIKFQDVKRAFEKPDQASKDFDGKLILKKKLNGKIVEIIYIIKNDKIFIITCYFL